MVVFVSSPSSLSACERTACAHGHPGLAAAPPCAREPSDTATRVQRLGLAVPGMRP